MSFLVLFVLFFSIPQFVEAENREGDLIIINKATNKLAFYKKGEFVKEYPVATGRSRSLTPEGTFTIVNTIKNRPYYKEKIPGGSPHNPLGDRWMGLDVPGTWGHTYGIHGTNNEYSIGKYVSAGCIRMHNDDVRELFEDVGNGSDVVITHTDMTFDEIAINHGYELKKNNDTTPIYALLEIHSKIPTYTEPNKYYKSTIGLLPQKVTTLKQSGSYYHVESWFGEIWVHEDDVILSPPREQGTYEYLNDEPPLLADNSFELMRYGLYYNEFK